MRSLSLAIMFCPALCLAAPLPLGGSANVSLVDSVAGDGSGGWTDQGAENSLQGFPSGEVSFSGVPFLIPAGDAPAAIAFRSPQRPDLPAEVSVPADGASGAYLCILSACAFDFSRGQEAAAVTVSYADGSSQSEPIAYEHRTGAWWTPSTPDNGIVAWLGKNGMGVPVGAYLSWIPLTGGAVKSVDIRSAATKGMFLLLGLSITDVPPPPIPPRWIPEPLDTTAWIPVETLRDNERAPVWAQVESGRRLAAELDIPLRAADAAAAARIARTVRLLGYNTVRLPSLETILPPAGSAVTDGFDPAARDSLQGVIGALQKENLSVAITLGGGRHYGIDDGVAAYRQIDARLANQILVDAGATRLFLDCLRSFPGGHPSSVSLLHSTVLLGDYGSLFTAPHRRMLQNAWHAWLLKRYGSDAALLAAWQVPDHPAPTAPSESLGGSAIELLNLHDFSVFQTRFRRRFADQMQFLEDLQSAWFAKVLPEIRKTFPGATVLTPGWMVADVPGDFQTRPALALDGIEESLPDSFAGTGTEGATYFINVSPFAPPQRWSYRQAFNRIQGKPFFIDENAAGWPGDYEFARILLTMAFGASQGWDSILHRSVTNLDPEAPMARGGGSANALQNPAVLGILPLGRNLFLRGDLGRSETIFSRALEAPADFAAGGPRPLPPALQNLLFAGGVEAVISGAAKSPANDPPAGTLRSTTGQLECDQAADLLKISTPASLALAGRSGGSCSADSVELQSSCGYGVVYATALDGRPLASSSAVLLGAVGRTRNSGQAVEISNGPLGLHGRLWRISRQGTAPILMEPAKATLTIPNAAPGRWSLQPLNLFGQPTDAKPRTLIPEKGTLRVLFDNSTSPLFLLRHEEI